MSVPIFYLISGYYIYEETKEKEKRKLKRRFLHTLKLLILFMSVALIYQLIISIIKFHDLMYILQFLKERITIENIIRSVLLSETLIGRGEWFLWAMLEGYGFLILSERFGVYDWIKKHAFMISMILLTIHIIGRWILILMGITSIGFIDLMASYSVRNVWFDALPFMLLGYEIRRKRYTNELKCKNKILIIIFAILIVISIFEFFICYSINSNVECVLYIGTVGACVTLLEISEKNPDIGKNSLIEYIGRELSSISYFIHVEVESIITTIVEMLGFGQLMIYKVSYPEIIVVMVLFDAQLLYTISTRIRRKKDKNNRGVRLKC